MLIVDGSSLASRAFHVKEGGSFPSFFNMMNDLIRDYLVNKQILFVFDNDENNFREEIYTDYKSNRKEDGRKEFIKNIYTKLIEHGFAVAVGSDGDDVIKYLLDIYDCPYVVSGDKDLFALVDQCILIWYGAKFRDRGVITENMVLERFGVNSWQLPDYKGFVGDPSDTIPGVNGVGHVGAVALIKEYGSGDAVFENPPTKGRYKFLSGKEPKRQYFLSKRLATIVPEEVEVVGDVNKIKFGNLIRELVNE